MLSLVSGDTEKMLDILILMGVLDGTMQSNNDRETLIELLGTLVTALSDRTAPAGNIHLIMGQQKTLVRNKRRIFRPKTKFMYLMRSGAMVDALAKRYNPDFDGVKLLQDIMPNVVDGSVVGSMMKDLFVHMPGIVERYHLP
jgi:hypothetical protein